MFFYILFEKYFYKCILSIYFNLTIHIAHLQQLKHKNRLPLITIMFYDTYIVSIVGGIWKRDTVIELYAANYPKNKCNS